MNDILIVKRVVYGKPDIDMKNREYAFKKNAPVGNIEELIEFVAIPNEYKKIHLYDVDGIWEVDVKTKIVRSYI